MLAIFYNTDWVFLHDHSPLMAGNEAILQQIQKRTIVRLHKVGLIDGDKNWKQKVIEKELWQ